jgi:hypothetical protein
LDILLSIPALSKPGLPQIAKESYHGITEALLFGGLSSGSRNFRPAKQKIPPLRPLRLCGENPILDKHDPV